MSAKGGPPIITDGLVLSLDAANNKSYPGSGTVWTDLSNSGNNGTLVNGPTFNTLNGGNIVFDGSNDHISFPTGFISTLSGCTFTSWFLKTNLLHSRVFDFGVGQYQSVLLSSRAPDSSQINNVPTFYIGVTSPNTQQGINGVRPLLLNTWYNYTITLDGGRGIMYENGIEISRNNNMSLTPINLGLTTNNWLARSQFSDPYFQGNISYFSIHNRVLTPAEVLQNYNAVKGRFQL